VQIITGILLLPLALLCLAGSVVLVFAPPDKAPLLAMSLGVVFILICIWVFWLAVRLLANHHGGGLLGPFSLKASTILFFALPIGGIFTGYWREKPIIAAIQTFCYLAVATALWWLAKARKHAS
jgi:hypothetical protein